MGYIYESDGEAKRVLAELGLNAQTPGRGKSYDIQTNEENSLPKGTKVGILLKRSLLTNSDIHSIIWIKESEDPNVRDYQENLKAKLDESKN